jgi:hypothetical protein
LAERHNLSLLELIDLLDSPQFIALLDRLNAIVERRAATIALHARPSALAGLEAVIATTTSPETARKAAATLVRASDRVLTPKRAHPQISTTQPEAPPETDATSTSPPDPASTPP